MQRPRPTQPTPAASDQPSRTSPGWADTSISAHDEVDAAFERHYHELRALAKVCLAAERPGCSVQATALVHEAYLRLVTSAESTPVEAESFHRRAAIAMQHILIDHARRRRRLKRGGDQARLTLDGLELAAAGDHDRILAVEAAIRRLEQQHADLADLVRLRFFVGLSVEETAQALGTPARTVARQWAYAKALLFRWLSKDA